MSAKPTYYELLRRPEWQKKRLEILSAANWKCTKCRSTDKTLNVHHSYYERGKSPWEYPNDSLHCLCEDCHKEVQDRNALLQRTLGKLDLQETDQVIGYAIGLYLWKNPEDVADVFSPHCAAGLAEAFRIGLVEMTSNMIDRSIDGRTLQQIYNYYRQRKE